MLLKQIMTQDVVVIEPSRSVAEAAKLMQKLNIGSLPICENGKLRGLITDRDIVIRAIAEDLDPKTTPLEKIVNEKLFYCYEEQTIDDAVTIMEFEQIRRLPILNQNKELVGMVSLGDIAVKTNQKELKSEALEAVSQPTTGTF